VDHRRVIKRWGVVGCREAIEEGSLDQIQTDVQPETMGSVPAALSIGKLSQDPVRRLPIDHSELHVAVEVLSWIIIQ
jgi:hypothetical protein